MSKDSKKKESKDAATTAVVLAENWSGAESVLGQPWCLVPLGTIPLLHYTLESLSRMSPPLKEVLVASSGDASSVEAAVAAWEGRWESLRVLAMPGATCVGDVLRELEERSEVGGDFLLLQAGVVPPPELGEAVREHKARRVKDKAAVLTLVVADAAEAHPGRLSGPESLLGLERDEPRQRVLLYEELHPDSAAKALSCPGTAELRKSLMETGMAVCSAQIPPLLTGENVDFRRLSDVVKEILTNEEIHGFKAHAHILPPTAACLRVHDLPSLIRMTPLFIQGWFGPVSPECVTGEGLARFRRIGRNRHFPMDSAHRPALTSVVLDKACLFGRDVKIGKGAVIRNSTLGDGVVIGDGCVVEESVVLAGAVVGPNSHLCQALLLPKAHIPPKSQAGPFTAIAVSIDKGNSAKFESGLVLVNHQPGDHMDLCAKKSTSLKGAFEWRTDGGASLWERRETSLLSQDFARAEAEVGGACGGASSESDEGGELGQLRDAAAAFFAEVKESLHRGLAEATEPENLKLEINSSKFAYNIRMEELNQLLSRAILELAAEEDGALFGNVCRALAKLKPLVSHYLASPEGQADFLIALEELVTTGAEAASAAYVPLLPKLLHHLYDEDVLGEEAILQWDEELEDDGALIIKPKIKPFVDWLKTAEEDSD